MPPSMSGRTFEVTARRGTIPSAGCGHFGRAVGGGAGQGGLSHDIKLSQKIPTSSCPVGRLVWVLASERHLKGADRLAGDLRGGLRVQKAPTQIIKQPRIFLRIVSHDDLTVAIRLA